MSVSLAALAAQALEDARKAEEDQQRQAEAQEAEKRQRRETDVRERLQRILTSDFLERLPPLEFHHTFARGYYQTTAWFPFADQYWSLCHDYRDFQDSTGYWNLGTAPLADTTQHTYFATRLSDEVVQSTLLVKMGEADTERTRAKLRQAVEDEAAQRRAQERAEEEEAQQIQRALRLEVANQEHVRLTNTFLAGADAAKAALWQWPAWVSITLYELHYCEGSSAHEGVALPDYRTGCWCATDTLDAHGYIRIESKMFADQPTRARDIKLDPSIHYPIWERHTISSLAELPADLKEDVTFSLPLVVQRRNEDDGVQRLCQVEAYRFNHWGYEEKPYSEQIGMQPLPWIRALVDAAAQLQKTYTTGGSVTLKKSEESHGETK